MEGMTLDSDNEDEVETIPQKIEPDEEKTDATLNGEIEILSQGMYYLPIILNDKYLVLSALEVWVLSDQVYFKLEKNQVFINLIFSYFELDFSACCSLKNPSLR